MKNRNTNDKANIQVEEKECINFYQGKTDLLKHIRDEHEADYNNQGNQEEGKQIGDNEELLEKKILEEIKAKISEFFNIKNIHFLFGSGTSSGAIPMMGGLFCNVSKRLISEKIDEEKNNGFNKTYRDILQEFKKIRSRITDKNNLEEILGILYSNRIYLENNDEKKDELVVCEKLIEVIEEEVFNQINVSFETDVCKKTLNNYQVFYQKLALRNRDLSRLNIFTTNNDLFNEMAMDSLNFHYINGFSGGLNRYFNPAMFNYTFSKRMDTSIDKYEPVDNVVNLYKIHGSVNWIEDKSNKNTFFNIKETNRIIKRSEKENPVLIYPTPTKQNKSLGSPYVELFREFQRRLLQPHSVLFIIGYSFSDEHVNNVIYQALATNSSINVVIINNIKDKAIVEIDDQRIFRIWGKDLKSNSIHYFNYIVNNLLPNVDHNKKQDEILKEFIHAYNKNLRP